jgi:hypothetical protein
LGFGIFFSFVETQSYYEAQADLEQMILLPQPPKCWKGTIHMNHHPHLSFYLSFLPSFEIPLSTHYGSGLMKVLEM